MIKNRLMTAEEALAYHMNMYPTLYASVTLPAARIKLFGQIFNVIGNGIDDYDAFAQEYSWKPELADMARGFPQKYTSAETLYRGCTAVNTNKDIQGLYTEAEKEFHPDVKSWAPFNRLDGIHKPYPNFRRGYSLLHRVDLNKFDDSWLQGGIEYYEYCRAYFSSALSADYHSAWPADTRKQLSLVNDYETAIARCIVGIDGEAAQWSAISKAYGTPYRGDTAVFIQDRWAKERLRIEQFINETLTMLESHLNNRQSAALTL